MGMFLSKYSMLNALGYGDDSYILPETKKIFSRFKLFGLIIHDPKAHIDFDNQLASIFERLDYITGPDFLFFCLTNPSNNWKRKADRDYFGIWELDKLLDPNNAYTAANDSISAFTLCNALGIDYNDLPCIILTNNFQFNKFRWIKTGAEHLENQMKEIGFFCNQKEDFFSLISDPPFNNLIHRIDFYRNTNIKSNIDPLAKTLSDFLSFIVADYNTNDRSKASKQVSLVLNKVFKNKSNIQDTDEFERSMLFVLGSLSNLTLKPNNECIQICFSEDLTILKHVDTSSKPITPTNINLEPSSKIILDTFNKVYPYFESLMSTSADIQELDYSPLVISLGKMFEIEINLSVIQWVRQFLNIEMPAFYNVRKIDTNDYSLTPSELFKPNPKPVNFNFGKDSRWNPPFLGESELVCKTLFSQNNYPNVIQRFDYLLEQWSIIRSIRNRAAHSQPVSYSQYSQITLSINHLVETNIFDQLINLKLSCKNPI